MALIQTKKQSFAGIGATMTITFDNPTTTGNLIVVGYSDNSGSNSNNLSSVTDGSSTFLDGFHNGTGNITYAALMYANGIIGQTTHTLTLNIDAFAQGASASVIIREYSGVFRSNAKDQGAANNGTNAFPDSNATPTTTHPYDLVIGYANADSNTIGWSPASSWGNFVVENSSADTLSSAMMDMNINTIGTPDARFILGSAPPNIWICLCVAFKISHLGISATNTSYRFLDKVIGY